MHVWRLTPIKANSPEWDDRYSGTVIVSAHTEEEARNLASSAFGDDMQEKVLGEDSPNTFLWMQKDYVVAEEITDRSWKPAAKAMVLEPKI